jgi:hypothetical protein
LCGGVVFFSKIWIGWVSFFLNKKLENHSFKTLVAQLGARNLLKVGGRNKHQNSWFATNISLLLIFMSSMDVGDL